eukprot:XP_028353463.1 stomatin-like protein 3 isoform X2 [Physeter catodon]
MIITFPISIWMCLKIIKEYERADVFQLGRIQADKAKGPDVFVKVDLQTVNVQHPSTGGCYRILSRVPCALRTRSLVPSMFSKKHCYSSSLMKLRTKKISGQIFAS